MNNNYQISNKPKKTKVWIVYLLIFATILTPSIRISSLPAFRIEQVVVIFFMMYLCLKLIINKGIKGIKSRFISLYTGFSFIIIFSILVGSLKGVRPIINDFFELYKIFIYLGIYVITVINVKEEAVKRKILRFMIFCLLMSVFISIQQYFNLFGLNEKYVPIVAPTQFKTLVNNYPYPRVVGMTPNPNEYAVMPGIGAIISWALFLSTNKKIYFVYISVFIIGVLMTLSRSGFIFTFVGIIVFALIYSSNFKKIMRAYLSKKTLKMSIISIFLIIVFIFVIFNYLPKELTWRILDGLNLKESASFQARLSNWSEHINYFIMSPIFGIGPAKSIIYEHSVDNEWLLFLRQYGIVGCFYIMLTFLSPLIGKKRSYFKQLYLSILVGCAIYMIPAAIYNSFQIMPLIMIFAGLVSNDK